jgi:sugar O-acyltransferase (sialic acid O-acetyltransferase NeuD family)
MSIIKVTMEAYNSNRFSNIANKIIVWGGTGQAKIVRPIIEYYNSEIIVIFDDTPNLAPPFPDIPLLHGKDDFKKWKNRIKGVGHCIAIGNPNGRVRISISKMLIKSGSMPITIVHPTAFISDNSIIGEGTQIMAGSIISPEVVIGKQCIINTKASVDHECILSDGVEIAPGATLCGLVKVKTNAWICAGATILPRITIGKDAIVGAGAVVTKDVPENTTVVGVPAKIIKSSNKS